MNSTFCSGDPLGYFAITKFFTINHEFCEIMAHTKNVIYFPINHILFILYSTLLVISLSIEIKEDFKWLIFNATLINFIFSCYNEIYIFFLSDQYELTDTTYIPNWIFHSYINDLSYLSGFPLALNRFVYSYFFKYYSKFSNTKNLISFILIFDVIILGFNFLNQFTIIFIIYVIFIILVQTISIIFFFLISHKFRQDAIRLKNISKTFHDVKRASIYCLIQAILSFILLSISIFLSVVDTYYTISQSNHPICFFMNLYIFLASMIEVFYSIALIIECFLTIFLLNTYRMVIWKFFHNLRKKLYKKENVTVAPKISRVIDNSNMAKKSNNSKYEPPLPRY